MRGAPSMKSAFGRRGAGRAASMLVPPAQDDDGGLDALQEAGMFTVPDARPRRFDVEYAEGALDAVAKANMATYMPGVQAPRVAGPRPRGFRAGFRGEDGKYGRMGPAIVVPQGVSTAMSPDRSGPGRVPRGAINLIPPKVDPEPSSGLGKWIAAGLLGLLFL